MAFLNTLQALSAGGALIFPQKRASGYDGKAEPCAYIPPRCCLMVRRWGQRLSRAPPSIHTAAVTAQLRAA
ncbi:MAG: hypothetical protein LBF87_00455, partial [Treponema sp.]|nr:hypothetical protein [Treponema sp.]